MDIKIANWGGPEFDGILLHVVKVLGDPVAGWNYFYLKVRVSIFKKATEYSAEEEMELAFPNLESAEDFAKQVEESPKGYTFRYSSNMTITDPLCADKSKEDVVEEKKETVNHPAHYVSHPSGVECIDIVEHHNFCVGNAIKYLWRAGLKTDVGMDLKEKTIEDLKKAIWYIQREIDNLSK